MEQSVEIRCTVVPDGLRLIKRSGAGPIKFTLKASILLEPVIATNTKLTLANWCSELETLRFHVELLTADGTIVIATPQPFADRYAQRDEGLSARAKDRLARGRGQTFANLLADPASFPSTYHGLVEALKANDQPLEANRATGDGEGDTASSLRVQVAGLAIDPANVRFYPYGTVARAATDTVVSEAARSLFLKTVATDDNARRKLRRQLGPANAGQGSVEFVRGMERRIDNPDDRTDRLERWRAISAFVNPATDQFGGGRRADEDIDTFFSVRQAAVIAHAQDLYGPQPTILERAAASVTALFKSSDDAGLSPLCFRTPSFKQLGTRQDQLRNFLMMPRQPGPPDLTAARRPDGDPTTSLAFQAFDSAWAAPLTDTARFTQGLMELGATRFDDREPCPVETPAELGRRRLAELHAQPTLMRFLRLLVDVEIPLDHRQLSRFQKDQVGEQLKDQPDTQFYGLIRARAERYAVADPAHTAFVLNLSHDRSLFEPCPEHAWPDREARKESLKQAFPCEDGFIDLRILAPVKGKGLGRRFSLETVDAAAALNAMRSQAAASTEGDAAGTPSSAVSTGSTELRSRGIALLDHGADVAHTISLIKMAQRTTTGALDQPFFADDLTTGYRLDIVHSGASPVAYPASARDLVYPVINRAYGQSIPTKEVRDWHPYPDFAHRDDGFIQPAAKEKPKPDEKDANGNRVETPPDVYPSEIVIAWDGRNLGVPSEFNPNVEAADEEDDCTIPAPLPAEVHYRLPANRLGPSLRTSRPYRAMLRARKANGASVEPASDRSIIAAFAVGSQEPVKAGDPDYPFIFRRPERIAAPTILLPSDDPILSVRAERTPTDSDGNLVIRSGRTNVIRRIVAAPRSDADSVEQSGLFDGHGERRSGVYQRIALTEKGAFPDAMRLGSSELKDKVGQLFRTTSGSSDRDNPYFVDPAGRLMAARLRLQDGRTLGWLSPTELLSFWQGIPEDAAVAPVVVDVRPTKGNEKTRLVRETAKLAAFGEVARLSVVVAPAEQLELELWPVIAPEARHHRLILSRAWDAADAAAQGLLDDGFVGRQLLQAGARQPLDELVSSRLITITHAVERPLKAPAFIFSSGRALQFVRLSDDRKDMAWPNYVENCLEHAPDATLCRLPDGGSLAYVFGQIRCHRPSTGSVRCEVAWLDYDRLIARRPVAKGERTAPLFAPEGEGLFVFAPRRRVETLFDLRDLPRQDRMADEETIDLVRDEANRLRSIVAAFDQKDGKARRLALRLIGTSRFVDKYPANEPQSPERFNSASATAEQMIAALDLVDGRPTLGAPIVWLDATIRPQPPQITRMVTMLPSVIDISEPGAVSVHRRVKTRLGLGANWFDSGEGEMLAVVCVPGNLVETERPGRDRAIGGRYPSASHHRTPSESWRRGDLKKRPPGNEWWASQWGMDPTTLTQMVEPNVIPSEAMSGYAWKLANQTLWARKNKDERYEPNSVALFVFEPRWDSGAGEWFVDLDIDAGQVKSPFARLVLVRYQAHAIHDDKKDFRLSEPLVLEDFKLYSPCRVRAERTETSIVVEIRAPTYSQRAPAIFSLQDPSRGIGLVRRAQSPTYKVEVAVESDSGGNILLFSDDCEAVETLINTPEIDEFGGGGVWRAELPIPASAAKSKLLVTVEEQEIHLDSRAVFDSSFEPISAIIKSPTPVSIVL